MATITKKDLESISQRIDSKLSMSVDLYVIGGASAILGYNIVKQTDDVDLDIQVQEEIYKVFAASALEVGIDVHLSHRGVFTPPDGYRERMAKIDFPNRRLRVWTLNQYDFAISKISRGSQKDYDDILKVHKVSAYDYNKLLHIFMEEFILVSHIGNPKETKMNLIDLVEKIFGVEKSAQARLDTKL